MDLTNARAEAEVKAEAYEFQIDQLQKDKKQLRQVTHSLLSLVALTSARPSFFPVLLFSNLKTEDTLKTT